MIINLIILCIKIVYNELVKLQGIPKMTAYLKEHPICYKKLKEAVDDAFVNFNAKLDATAIEISEEAAFQEEKKELKKRLEEGTASDAEKQAAMEGYITDEEWDKAAKEADEKTITSDEIINEKYKELSGEGTIGDSVEDE